MTLPTRGVPAKGKIRVMLGIRMRTGERRECGKDEREMEEPKERDCKLYACSPSPLVLLWSEWSREKGRHVGGQKGKQNEWQIQRKRGRKVKSKNTSEIYLDSHGEELGRERKR